MHDAYTACAYRQPGEFPLEKPGDEVCRLLRGAAADERGAIPKARLRLLLMVVSDGVGNGTIALTFERVGDNAFERAVADAPLPEVRLRNAIQYATRLVTAHPQMHVCTSVVVTFTRKTRTCTRCRHRRSR